MKASKEAAKTNDASKVTEEINWEIRAFEADAELANYRYRVEAGLLSEEEQRERREFLDFLGYTNMK